VSDPARHDARAGAVFHALGDPTRRQVVQALARHGSLTASAIAADLPVSRQAVAKHLAALREAGLARATPSGREVRYDLTPAPMAEAVAWITRTGAEWDERLARLQASLEA
jgi:DNA-binding transcriptional ArsR family regulator